MILYDNYYTDKEDKKLMYQFTFSSKWWNPANKQYEKRRDIVFERIPNFLYHELKDKIQNKEIKERLRNAKYLYQFPKTAVNYINDSYEDLTVYKKIENIKMTKNFELEDFQQNVINEAIFCLAKGINNGIIVSPVGSGKTYMALELIYRYQVTTLIIVPSVVLLYQWRDRIAKLLNLPIQEIGLLGDGNKEIKPITVGVFKTTEKVLDKIKDYFTMIIIDETHRVPANTYVTILKHTKQRYTYGFTATYNRKDNKEYLIKAYVSNNIIENTETNTLKPCVYIINTGIRVPYLNYVNMLTKLAENKRLNNLITQVVEKAKQFKGKQLILTARRKQVSELSKLIPKAKVITGDTIDRSIDNYDVIITTNVLNEGFDVKDLGILHIVYPNNNLPKLEQIIGRIVRHHENKDCIVFDYWFSGMCKGFSIEKSQETRLKYYIQKGYDYKVVR